MPDRLMKQGYDPETSKDRVGQEIDERGNGKLAPASAARVDGPVLRTSPNFKRATIQTTSPNELGQKKTDWELVDEKGNGEPQTKKKSVMQGAVNSIEAPGPDREPRSNSKKRAGTMEHLKED